MTNEKYVQALWDCYQQGIGEELEEKELFMKLIDDAINQIIERTRAESCQADPIVSWEKQCNCNGYSSMPDWPKKSKLTGNNYFMPIKAPICEKCGKPWKLVSS